MLDLVEYITCKTPPLSFSWLQISDQSILEDTSHKKPINSNLHSKNLDEEIDNQRSDSFVKRGLLQGKRPEKQDNSSPMRELGKRPFDCIYVESQVKTLLSSGKVKVKKSKKEKFSG